MVDVSRVAAQTAGERTNVTYLSQAELLTQLRKIKDGIRRNVIERIATPFNIGDKVQMTVSGPRRSTNNSGTVLGFCKDETRGFCIAVLPTGKDSVYKITIDPQGYDADLEITDRTDSYASFQTSRLDERIGNISIRKI